MKKEKLVWKKFFIYFSFILCGLLLGYYLRFQYSHKQMSTIPICDALTNITPASGTKITSPLTVTVTVDNTKSCKWTVFEAQAGTMTLKDTKGQTLGTGILKTTHDWMTEQPVEYSGTIEFTKPATNDVTLVFTEEDPSGKGGKTVTIPLRY